MWSGGSHDDFLGTNRNGKLPGFKKFSTFSPQPTNTQYNSNSYPQVSLGLNLEGFEGLFCKA